MCVREWVLVYVYGCVRMFECAVNYAVCILSVKYAFVMM